MEYTNREAGWSFLKLQNNAVLVNITGVATLSSQKIRLGQRLISLWELDDGGFALGTVLDLSGVNNGDYVMLGTHRVPIYQGDHGSILTTYLGDGDFNTASTIMLNGSPLARNSLGELIVYQGNIGDVEEFDSVVFNNKKLAVGRIGDNWYLHTMGV